MSVPDSLFERLDAAANTRMPPVDAWHPASHGDSFMKICADGRWLYRGTEIRRPEMVRLFSTLLRCDPDGFVLVTPAERLSIEVEDAPFVAIEVERRGAGSSQEIAFATNVGELVVADPAHAIEMRDRDGASRPYVHVRSRLDARIARAAFYRLVEFADADGYVLSRGVRFPLR